MECPNLLDPVEGYEFAWDVIGEFMNSRSLIAMHIDGYNNFLLHILPDLVKSRFPIQVSKKKLVCNVSNVTIAKPRVATNDSDRPIFPVECIERNIAYNCTIYADVIVQNGDVTTEYNRINIGNIPCMVGSVYCNTYGLSEQELYDKRECPMSLGGYVIGEKGICYNFLAQERLEQNRPFVLKAPAIAHYRKYKFITESRSDTFGKGERNITCSIGITKTGTIDAIFPTYLDKPLNAMLVLKGIAASERLPFSIEALISYVLPGDLVHDEKLYSIIAKAAYSTSDLDPIVEMSKCFGQKVNSSVHLNYSKEIIEVAAVSHNYEIGGKTHYYADSILHLVLVWLEREAPANRDSFETKRIEGAGELFCQQFISALNRIYMQNLKTSIEKQFNIRYFSNTDIESAMWYAIRTGKWTVSKGRSGRGASSIRIGVTQAIETFNRICGLENCRKMTSSTGHEDAAILSSENLVDPSQWGVIDPTKTPDSKKVGKIKQQAITCRITTPTTMTPLIRRKIIHLVDKIILSKPDTKVFFNGELLGTTQTPQEFVEYLRLERLKGKLDRQMSISYNKTFNKAYLSTQPGRVCRPLFICSKGQIIANSMPLSKYRNSLDKWNFLIENGYVGYIDKTEENTLLIAMTPFDVCEETNYCELHPSVMLGISSGLIPFPECSLAPRVTYQAAMGTQAIGLYALNMRYTMMNPRSEIYYPQKPLCQTKLAKYVGYDKLPTVQNVLIAILAGDGSTQEDALEFNRRSLDFGLFDMTYFTSISVIETKKIGSEELIIGPIAPEIMIKQVARDYTRVNPETGIIDEGTFVEEGTVLVCVTKKLVTKEGIEYKDESIFHKISEKGVVNRVVHTTDINGRRMIHIELRHHRPPLVGDKFAEICSQKGTLGRIKNSEDMPFIASGPMAGISPDVVLHCAAFPSRRTINLLHELIYGTYACMEGIIADVTGWKWNEACREKHHEFVQRKVKEGGLGDVVMIDGETGNILGTLENHGIFERVEKRQATEAIEGETKEGPFYEVRTSENTVTRYTRCTATYRNETITTPLGKFNVNRVGDVYDEKNALIGKFTFAVNPTMVSVGFGSYQRLKHMVLDKMSARDQGKVTSLTRQPANAGRKRGLQLTSIRFGVMEVDALNSANASLLIEERLGADAFPCKVCTKCGIIGHKCPDGTSQSIIIPYIWKLIVQEFMAMGILIRIRV